MLLKNFPFYCLLVFWLIQASTLGISDDEAYYWVLSQSPALGYVYHPPMVAWLIALAEFLLEWLSLSREFLVRLPGVALGLASLWINRRWLLEAQKSIRQSSSSWMIWPVLPGLAILGWMMVPDHSLLFAWSLGLYSCWKIIQSKKPASRHLLALSFSAAIGLLSKFSAVLFCFSALMSILLFSKERLRPIAALLVGMAFAALPIFIWNSQNEWFALLYQFHSRHSGSSWDLRRYGLFWLSQLLVAGPFLALAVSRLVIQMIKRKRPVALSEKYLLLWFFPASVFLVQPAYSDFKPHWAIVAWLPLLLLFALRSQTDLKTYRYHTFYSASFIVLSFFATHFPLTSFINEKLFAKPTNPLWDMSNDLSGWAQLPQLLEEKHLSQDLAVTGSRYQTASQAAFALYPKYRFTLVPKNSAEAQEWPALHTDLEELGPGKWPKLLRPVLFVHDDRYVQTPLFPDSSCEKSGLIQPDRFGYASKRIHIWLCEPKTH